MTNLNTQLNTKSIVSLKMKINGNIELQEELEHHGSIVGDVTCASKVTLKEYASIEGNIKAEAVYIETGNIVGNIDCSTDVVCLSDSKIVGNLYVLNADIAGKIEGNIKSTHEVKLSSTAVVVGDIEAYSLQVEAGAQIKGLISIKG